MRAVSDLSELTKRRARGRIKYQSDLMFMILLHIEEKESGFRVGEEIGIVIQSTDERHIHSARVPCLELVSNE